MRLSALLAFALLLSLGSADAQTTPAATVPTNALLFNGQPAQSVQVSSAVFNVTTALTIEAWVNVTSWTKRDQAIVTKGDAWGLIRNSDKAQIAFRTALSGPAGGTDDLVSTTDFPLGVWTHVAAVFTGTRKQLYINGVLTADAAYAGPLVTNNFAVTFGSNAAVSDRTLNGTIDSVRLWSVARSGTDLKSFAAEYMRGSEPGLLGDWRFNESNGSTALDSSSAGRNGTLQLGKPPTGSASLPQRTTGLALAAPRDGEFAVFLKNNTAQYPLYAGLPAVPTAQFIELPEPLHQTSILPMA